MGDTWFRSACCPPGLASCGNRDRVAPSAAEPFRFRGQAEGPDISRPKVPVRTFIEARAKKSISGAP